MALDAWIPVTLAAATFQILRTSRQHRLRSVLGVNAAGFVRYAYGLPLACVVAAATFLAAGRDVPSIPPRFWVIVTVAGAAQILGTVALLRSFELRDFAIGTVYAKTEIVLVAVVSAVALDEPLSVGGWMAIVVCMFGVIWLAAPDRLGEAASSLADPAAFMGVAAAGGFAVAAVGIRAAATSLGEGSTWDRAILTLTVMLAVQTTLNGVQLAVTRPSDLVAVARSWRAAVPVGVLSLAGSACWAVAVTLTNAAKVRTLGQVELLIAFAISAWWLGERHRPQEYLASALVMLGVIGVIVVG